MMGVIVVTESGKDIGKVDGFTVDPKTSKMTSVVLAADQNGTKKAAVPMGRP